LCNAAREYAINLGGTNRAKPFGLGFTGYAYVRFTKEGYMKKAIITFITIFSAILVFSTLYILINGNYLHFPGVYDEIRAVSLSSILQGITGILLTLISTLLIIYTIVDANSKNEMVSIENNVLKMIDYHRQNYEDIIKMDKDFFVFGFTILFKYKNVLEPIINDILSKDEKAVIKEIPEDEILDLSYLFYFFGYNSAFDNKILLFYNKREKKSLSEENIKLISSNLQKYSNGTALVSSKYFRQMYNIIQFIDEKDIQLKEKIRLSKLLRVQLSNQEQSLLFFNSISQVGYNWKKTRIDKKIKYNYIERYNILRNISSEDLGKIDLKKYYPNLKLEHEL
jgi:uncharacterized FlaG/YvyC family protein